MLFPQCSIRMTQLKQTFAQLNQLCYFLQILKKHQFKSYSERQPGSGLDMGTKDGGDWPTCSTGGQGELKWKRLNNPSENVQAMGKVLRFWINLIKSEKHPPVRIFPDQDLFEKLRIFGTDSCYEPDRSLYFVGSLNMFCVSVSTSVFKSHKRLLFRPYHKNHLASLRPQSNTSSMKEAAQ